MRILQVAYKSEITGGEKVLFILAKHFRNRGHYLLVVCPTHGPLVGALRKEGIEVKVIPIKKSYDFVAALRLRDLIRRKGIQVLH
ncbi:MAG: glycosyltransferase, partial [Candidatus Hodarchaeota archaeon]